MDRAIFVAFGFFGAGYYLAFRWKLIGKIEAAFGTLALGYILFVVFLQFGDALRLNTYFLINLLASLHFVAIALAQEKYYRSSARRHLDSGGLKRFFIKTILSIILVTLVVIVLSMVNLLNWILVVESGREVEFVPNLSFEFIFVLAQSTGWSFIVTEVLFIIYLCISIIIRTTTGLAANFKNSIRNKIH